MRTLSIWTGADAGPGGPLAIERPIGVSEAGVLPPGNGETVDSDAAVLLAPAPQAGRGGAIVLVPDAMSDDVTLNGAPLGGGAHLVQHADRLRVGRSDYWIATQVSPETTRYDPARHGEGMFCFRTKARLEKGDEVLVCEGTPTNPCGMLYRAQAWLPDSPCANCGFDPSAPAWRPPVGPRRKTLDALLQLAARSSRP